MSFLILLRARAFYLPTNPPGTDVAKAPVPSATFTCGSAVSRGRNMALVRLRIMKLILVNRAGDARRVAGGYLNRTQESFRSMAASGAASGKTVRIQIGGL